MRARGFFAALLLAGCAAAVHHAGLDPADGSVLRGPAARETLSQCSHYGPAEAASTWVPGSRQIEQLESRLPAFLRDQDRRPPGDPRTYYRQYVGVVLDGRQFIYVNGLPKAMRTLDGWRSRAIVVCDGGPHYWGVLYDPKTKRFSKYSANGEA